MFGPSRRVSRRTARRTSRRVSRRQAAFAPEPTYPEPPAQQAPPQQPPPAPAEPSYVAELQRLAELKSQGLITDEEYEAKKKQVLGL